MAPKFTTQSAREAFDEICERAVLSEKAMDALARLGRELAELQQATRWQPIETAPRDGTFVLLSGRDLPVWQGSWVGTSGRYAINGWTRFNSVDINWNQTHWKPLPEPPSGT